MFTSGPTQEILSPISRLILRLLRRQVVTLAKRSAGRGHLAEVVERARDPDEVAPRRGTRPGSPQLLPGGVVVSQLGMDQPQLPPGTRLGRAVSELLPELERLLEQVGGRGIVPLDGGQAGQTVHAPGDPPTVIEAPVDAKSLLEQLLGGGIAGLDLGQRPGPDQRLGPVRARRLLAVSPGPR